MPMHHPSASEQAVLADRLRKGEDAVLTDILRLFGPMTERKLAQKYPALKPDLEDILAELPDLWKQYPMPDSTSSRLQATLQKVCGQWTVYARYSISMANIGEAESFSTM